MGLVRAYNWYYYWTSNSTILNNKGDDAVIGIIPFFYSYNFRFTALLEGSAA